MIGSGLGTTSKDRIIRFIDVSTYQIVKGVIENWADTGTYSLLNSITYDSAS